MATKFIWTCGAAFLLCGSLTAAQELEISGVRPALAAFNQNGECGIGAVAPWANRLWFFTYPPHFRHGSADKLYSLDEKLNLTIHPESVGGTHANRFIHRESQQLFIGPYVIDATGKIRVIDVKTALPGRLTATTRHPLDPANKVIFFDMEGPIWEVDVKSLETKKLFEKPVPGWHGKGAYTGQGRLIVANNGESAAMGDLDKTKITADLKAHGAEDAGVLGEWDGKEWRIIERRQFTDVTGPGGIVGNEKDSDPVWAMGWDKRSVILKLLDGGKWSTFRLPKASHAFDPKHGWYTEWPRIREIGAGIMLAVMHGTIFDFPKTFSAANTNGIRPIATHLRYIPDLCEWNGKLVIAEDSTSAMQNPLAGQSQSNLWFGTLDEVKKWGGAQGWGGPWLGDAVKANENSAPYLFAGYAQRMVHVAHNSKADLKFTFETDNNGAWKEIASVTAPASGYAHHIFPADAPGEFIRVRTDQDCPAASCYFHYLPNMVANADLPPRFQTLPIFTQAAPTHWAYIRPAKENRNLQVVATTPAGKSYIEVDENLKFTRIDAPDKLSAAEKILEVPEPTITEDSASLIATAPDGRRFRIPRHEPVSAHRIREVMSERFLANLDGTFYEIPRAEGPVATPKPDFKKMKPVASHPLAISDFCSWRGLLVLAAQGKKEADSGGLWFGVIDDLWKLGKLAGEGGPWAKSPVKSGEPSDPFLMTNFDRKSLDLSHDSAESVEFKIEVDYSNRDFWKTFATLTVKPGEKLHHDFPAGYAAYWVRVVANKDCTATAFFQYK